MYILYFLGVILMFVISCILDRRIKGYLTLGDLIIAVILSFLSWGGLVYLIPCLVIELLGERLDKRLF